MAVPSLGAQGGYANVTAVIPAAGQTAVLAEIDKLLALLVPSDNVSPASPDFIGIDKVMSTKIAVEIAALKAAIDAAPTA